MAIYNFTGSPILFRVQPNPWTMTSYHIEVDEHRHAISLGFKLFNQDVAEFNRAKNDAYSSAFANIYNVNNNTNEINVGLHSHIEKLVRAEKNRHLKENVSLLPSM